MLVDVSDHSVCGTLFWKLMFTLAKWLLWADVFITSLCAELQRDARQGDLQQRVATRHVLLHRPAAGKASGM